MGKGIVTGIHHTSITVRDMRRSVAFYRDVLGFEEIWSSDAHGWRLEGPVADAVTNCPGTRQRLVFMRAGESLIELVEYEPTQDQPEHKASDTGSMHICLRTDDIDALYRRVVESGVRTHCEPQQISEDARVFYFRDPDGAVLEVATSLPV